VLAGDDEHAPLALDRRRTPPRAPGSLLLWDRIGDEQAPNF